MSNEKPHADGLTLLQALTALEVDYWYEVDHNWGRQAHRYYAEGGIFAIGDKKMQGQDAVAAFLSMARITRRKSSWPCRDQFQCPGERGRAGEIRMYSLSLCRRR